MDRYTKVIYILGSLFAVFPFPYCTRIKISHCKASLVWHISVFIYRILLNVGLCFYPEIDNSNTGLLYIIDVVSYCTYGMLPLFAPVISQIFMRKWEQFIETLNELEDTFSIVHKTTATNVISLFQLSLLGVQLIYDYRFQKNYSEDKVIYNIWRILYIYLEEGSWLLVFISLGNFVQVIRSRYIYLSQYLTKFCSAAIENSYRNVHIEIVAVRRIREVKVWYKSIHSTISHLSSLYGFPIMILLMYSILEALLAIITTLLVQGTESIMDTTNCTEMILVFTYVIYVIVNCEMAVAEGRKVLKTCYILEDKFPIRSPVRQELLELIDQAHYHTPVFTAFDLFELNRCTFLALISVLTTYFIVSIQFIMMGGSP